MRLATVDPYGLPHVGPIWYLADRDDGSVCFSTPTDSPKIRDIAETPKASLIVDEGGYKSELRAVVVEGNVSWGTTRPSARRSNLAGARNTSINRTVGASETSGTEPDSWTATGWTHPGGTVGTAPASISTVFETNVGTSFGTGSGRWSPPPPRCHHPAGCSDSPKHDRPGRSCRVAPSHTEYIRHHPFSLGQPKGLYEQRR